MELDIERIQELLGYPVKDNASGRALFEALKPQVRQLLAAYATERGRDGGKFGRRVLEAVEETVLKKVDGRAELTDEARLLTCAVSVVPQRVYVDLRLEVVVL